MGMKAATTMMKPEMSAAFSSWQSVPAEERTVDEPAVEEPMTESLIVDVASIRRLEMAQLHEMGFVDEDANRTALDTAFFFFFFFFFFSLELSHFTNETDVFSL